MSPKWDSWNAGTGGYQSGGNWNGGHAHGQAQWWKCPCKECVTRAGQPTWNHPTLRMCKCCGEPRESPKIEEEAHRVKIKERIAERKAKEVAGGGATPAAAPAKRKRKSKKSRKALAAKEEPEEVAPMDEESEDESDEPPADPAAAAAEQQRERRRHLLGLLLLAAAPLTKLYPVSSEFKPPTAAAAAAKALSGQASEKIATLQTQVAELTSLAGMCSRTMVGGEKSPAYLDIAKQLEEKTTALKKVLKDTPARCSKVTEGRLRTARQDLLTAQAATEERCRSGREKALARFKSDQSDFDSSVAELIARKAAAAKAFLESQASFAASDSARLTHEAEVVALVDKKVLEATPVGGQPAAVAGQAPAAPARPEGYADLELQADVQLWSVPVLTEEVLLADAPAKEQIERAWAFFSNTPTGSMLPPMTYQQLGFTSMKTLPLVIGDNAMRAFYARRTIVTTCYIPWQIVELVRYSLTQSNQCLARDATSKEEALERLKLARDAATENGYQRAPY